MFQRIALVMDIECFSRLPTAAVSEISLVLMDLATGSIMGKETVFLNPFDQNGHIEESTKKWCLKNLPGVNLEKSFAVTESRTALDEFIKNVNSLITKHQLEKGKFRIYSRGSNFDLPIFQSLLSRESGKPHAMWDFRSEYCHRTVLEIAFSDEDLLKAEDKAIQLAELYLECKRIEHDSYHDAVYEAFLLHLAYKKIESLILEANTQIKPTNLDLNQMNSGLTPYQSYTSKEA